LPGGASTGRIVDANHAAAAFYGWSREQLARVRIQEINTLSPAEVDQEMARARGLGEARFEFRHRQTDGSIRDVDVFTSRIELHGKDFLHSIVHDSSARRQAERSLAKPWSPATLVQSVSITVEDRGRPT
jgi:two-component system cell cycle sensor histidine kinase/response regulator CckA